MTANCRPSILRFRCLCALLAIMVTASLFLLPRELLAQAGGVVSLPPASVKPKNGLRMTVDTTWVENYGYRPVKVTVTSTKPAAADTTITFRFRASDDYSRNAPKMAVDQDIVIAEKTTSASATVLVPQFVEWYSIGWDTLIDGEFDDQLSQEVIPGSFSGNTIQGGGTARMLFVASEASDVVSVTGTSNVQSFGGPTGSTYTTQQVQLKLGNTRYSGSNLSTVAAKKIADLPQSWLGYTALDYVVLTHAQLAELQQRPEQFDSLVQWVLAGGDLWIFEFSDNWQELIELKKPLSRLLGPKADRWHDLLRGNLDLHQVFSRESVIAESATSLDEIAGVNGGKIALHTAGMGSVIIATNGKTPFNGVGQLWTQQSSGTQLAWASRHGTALDEPNPDFATYLIPGVGSAPVTEFRILITLFVVLIGPVNYWLLKRKRRLHLLILTVPLGAMLVTGALFLYAIVADGLSTRLRVLSYTYLDQPNQQAVSWSRLSYYAGLAPSDGLEFSKDTAIYPINSGWNDSGSFASEMRQKPRSMQWADKQYLTTGWLSSRTPTQYLTITARQSDKRLDVVQSANGPRITNHLATAIELLVLRDKSGKLFVGEQIAKGASTALKLVDSESKLRTELQDRFTAAAPETPEGFSMKTDQTFARPLHYQFPGRHGNPIGTMATSRLEQRLASFTKIVVSTNGRSVNLDDGTYLAITHDGCEVETGVEAAQQESSFHVVEGRW